MYTPPHLCLPLYLSPIAMSATNNDNTESSNYVMEYLPPDIVERLEAGAFQSLCAHLRERSDQVQNIDLMTISGFCRNCLAKWLVVEARKVSGDLSQGSDNNSVTHDDLHKVIQALDAMGYDEAAQYVYGMDYPEWKKRHAAKATNEQMDKFNESKPLWAKHNKEMLAKRASVGPPARASGMTPEASPSVNNTQATSLLSNVCCEPTEQAPNTNPPSQKQQQERVPLAQSLPLPASLSFSLGVLTVSDRASAGEYQDLSGPAVQQAVRDVLSSCANERVQILNTKAIVVPDDIAAIQQQLKEWSNTDGDGPVDLILSTGGTGFAPRDVTPEATEGIVDHACPGLITYCTMECATKIQPLASLSRGTAGIRGSTLIVNLPGNPKGVREIVPILLPLALHAVADVKG
ncbi:MAG: hypothetical protein SGILL_008798 [Bacillariaceae sp.]